MNAPQTQMTPTAAAVLTYAAPDEQNELERLLNQAPGYVPKPRDFVLSSTLMARMMAFAEIMAKGTITTPDHLRNKVGDCFAIVMQSMLWNMDPFAVAQKTHLVSGRLGYEAQLVNAVLQKSGAIVGTPKYEFDDGAPQGQAICRVGCVLAGESEITWGEWYSSQLVTVKNSPLWKTNPRQQMGYLQLKNWARLYAPGAILGVSTVDELLDVPDELRDMPPAPPPGPRRKARPAGDDVQQAAATRGADQDTGEIPPPAEAPAPAPDVMPAEQSPREPAPQTAARSATPPAQPTGSRGRVSGGQANYLRQKIAAAKLDESGLCTRYGVEALEQLNVDAFDELKAELLQIT